MKRSISFVLVLALVLALVVAVPVFAAMPELISIEVAGVPTLYVEQDGVQILDENGEKVDAVDKDNVVLVGAQDFDMIEEEIRDKLLNSPDLPMYFLDKSRGEQKVQVDPDSVSLIFDFFFEGVGSEVLDPTDGKAADLHFELLDEMNPGDLLIAQYIDGVWHILDPEFYSVKDGLLDLKLENEGMLAFFALRAVTPGHTEEREIEEEDEPDPEEPGYRPSVENRGYPSPVPAEPGVYYVLETVYVKLADGKPAKRIPLSEVKIHGADDFTEEEMAAYKLLEEAENLADVCDNLPEDVPAEDLVVRDVFSLNYGPTAEEFLEENEDSCFAIKFRYSIKEGDTFIVLHFVDEDGDGEGEWVALPPECVEVEDGFVTVKLRDTGLLAFVVESPDKEQ